MHARLPTQCLFLHLVFAPCIHTLTCLVATLLTSFVRTLTSFEGLVYLRALRRQRRRPATHNGGKPLKKTVELLPQQQLCQSTIGLLAR